MKELTEKLNQQLATMRMPGSLEKRIKELNLGLERPLPAMVWRLNEPVREGPRSGTMPREAGELQAMAGNNR